MTIEEFAKSYFDFNRISDGRRKMMLNTMERFEVFSGHPIEEITSEAFRAWLVDLVGNGSHVNTVRKLGNVIRAYVRHAWEQDQISDSVYLRVRLVKNPRGATGMSEPNPYTLEEVRQLFNWIDNTFTPIGHITLDRWTAGAAGWNTVWRHFMRLQVRAIVFLALDCGLRRKEILGALMDDISPENEVVLVRMGKSKISDEPRYREVQFTSRSREAVYGWLRARDLIQHQFEGSEVLRFTHGSPWLVLRPPSGSLAKAPVGSPMPMFTLERLITPWSLHRLRHTAATMWLRGGMPLEKVSQAMGHATLQQTLCYAKLNRGDLVAAAAKAEQRFTELTGGAL